jgi:carboxyl-terminal processing protease
MAVRRRLVAALLLTACASTSTAPIPATPAESFDRVWSSFDRTYPYFGLKGVDWAAAKGQYRDRASAATSTDALNPILVEMLARLRDVHVSLRGPNGATIPTYRPTHASNFDRDRWQQTMSQSQYVQRRPDLGSARVSGVPYITIGAWNSAQFSVSDLDAVLEPFRSDSVLIVDVRMNGGGNDQLALNFAGRFFETPTLSEQYRYRTGPSPNDLGRLSSRVVAPRGPWPFRGRVYVLIGRSVFSSNESFVAAMRVAPRAILVGDTTGGGTANPEQVPYAPGWTVSVSRWFATLPDGQPIEGRGIAPNVYVPMTAGTTGDPIIAAAVALIAQPSR